MQRFFVKLFLVFLSILFTPEMGMATEDQNMLSKQFQSFLPDFSNIRRQLHAMPELKYQEKETSKIIAETLRSYGYQVKTGVGKTGVTAVLDSGKPGKTVMLRADMDGLPIKEETGLSYQSKNVGIMHACGHDGHVATLLMVAKVLKKNTNLFNGKIKFIFQPAEEGGAGARAMIDDGVLENPKVDVVFGYHNWPAQTGEVATRVGSIMASSDSIEIQIHGKGGHAAAPHLTINPILIGARLIHDLQQLISQKNPMEIAVLNVASFNSGTAHNVVPDDVIIKGTLRTLSSSSRDDLISKIEKLTKDYANSYGAKGEFLLRENSYPPTINSAPEVALVLNTASEILPKEKVRTLENSVMPAEDFSFYLQKVPGCFFFVGHGEGKSGLHTNKYDFNDEIMPIAAYVLAKTAINYLNGQ